MSLVPFVQTLGRGPGRARSLTQAEARDAMAGMLSDDADPEAVGAILMLLRMKGEVAAEIAGFADAAQAALPDLRRADLDWPCYAAGRTRGLPWFLLSARLVTQAGYRVQLHGADTPVRAHLAAAGISLGPCEAPVSYLPLEAVHPALSHLLNLRATLGLRSCVNTICRMLNPGRARASVQGVFHPSYRELQADAAQLLGWDALCVIKGGGGEFERHPGKGVVGFGLRGGRRVEHRFAALDPATGRLSDGATATDLGRVWDGTVADGFATQVVIGTAALALETLGGSAPQQLAERLWAERHGTQKETAA